MNKQLLSAVLMSLPLLLSHQVAGAVGSTSRVSVDSSGAQANNLSFSPALSADGRFVAFYSEATNLVPGDTSNGQGDIFVRDRQTGQTTRVSVDSFGAQATGNRCETGVE